MLNLKLRTIASLIEKDDVVLDTCCDHAYLAIYVKENKLGRDVVASDISEAALLGARENIKKKGLDIKTYLADGFKGIDCTPINTAVIAGVGTTTALNIMTDVPKSIKKVIISSNNDHYTLRKKMQDLGFYLTQEKVVFEKEKFYPIMVFDKERIHLSEAELKFGISQNKEYLKYILEKEKSIYEKIPAKEESIKKQYIQDINFLEEKLQSLD